MRLVILDDDGTLAGQIRDFGWEIADSPHDGEVDAILAASPESVPAAGDVAVIQILVDGTPFAGQADDFIVPPLRKEYLALRIASAQKRRQKSLSEVAKLLHDLRSPLNAIQGYAEMIAEEATGEQVRYAARIRTAVEQMDEMLRSQRKPTV